jgi:predicted nucleic acid-binding Zn ribbon protein
MPWQPLPSADADGPQPLAPSIDRLMTRLSGVSLSTIEVVMDRWAAIVGDDAARVSDPVKLVDGVLTVRVDDAIWASEIRWLEPTVVARVQELASGAAIAKVNVVVRPR